MGSSVEKTRGLAALGGVVAMLIAGGCNKDHDGASVTSSQPASRSSEQVKAGPQLPSQPPTNDPKVLLKRMVAAYKSLNSLQQTSEADIKVSFPRPHQEHQSTLLKYSKIPPHILYKLASPSSGTQTYFADGSTVVHYSAVSNQYTRYSRGNTIELIGKRIDRSTLQILTPISFLLGDDVPDGLENAMVVGSERVNGRDAYKVHSGFQRKYLTWLALRMFHAAPKTATGECTLYVDKRSNLLLRSSLKLAWLVRVMVDDQIAETRIALDAVETVTESVQNPVFAADDFRFLPPKGAGEIFVESAKQIK